jgi:type VII secretion protein EccE
MTATQTRPSRAVGVANAQQPELRTRRGSARIAGVSAAQLVAAEIAVLAVAVSLDQPVWMLVVLAMVALLVVSLAFVRRHGRWWFQHLLVQRRFKRRVRRAQAVLATGVAGPLEALAPGIKVTQITDRGNLMGIGQDWDGWFAGLAVTRADTSQGAPAHLLNQLGSVLMAPGMPASALQAVVHTVPAPTSFLERDAPAVASYLELLNGEPPPAVQQVWVAIRLTRADALSAAAARGGGIEGVHRTLAAAAGRVSKGLRAGGFQARTLDADALTTAIATVGDLGAGGPDAEPREEWRHWTAGGLAHVSYVLGGLPARSLGTLLEELQGAPLMSATLAVLLTPGDGEATEMEALLRTAAPGPREDEVAQWVRSRGEGLGITLRRLDGQQAVGVYSVAPTGGGTP